MTEKLESVFEAIDEGSLSEEEFFEMVYNNEFTKEEMDFMFQEGILTYDDESIKDAFDKGGKNPDKPDPTDNDSKKAAKDYLNDFIEKCGKKYMVSTKSVSGKDDIDSKLLQSHILAGKK